MQPASVTSKFIAIYTRLLQGIPPTRLDANGNPRQLFSDLLDLKVDSAFLTGQLQQLSKDECVGRLQPFLSSLFEACLRYASTAAYGEARKDHALETLAIVSRCCLSKNLSGWEVMEMVAGSAGQSDRVFNEFTLTLNTIIGDNGAPAETRCHAVRLGLAFVCAISQLSAGAYFLRRNLFPSIIGFIKSRETEEPVLEAALFLAILANYHKSDAAKMNHYLKRIKECDDDQAMRNICHATIPALDAAVRAYIASSNAGGIVSNLNLTTLTSLLRPDRLLWGRAVANASPKVEIEERQPIAQAVALLPIYEFVSGNASFVQVLVEDIDTPNVKTPWIGGFLNFASHLFTNASSSSSSRTISYANLTLEIILVFVDNRYAMNIFSTQSAHNIQLCRQRQPRLPLPRPGRPVICDVLDCCNLWLRHNLNRRLSVRSYAKCIWICHRIVWYLQYERIRLDYEWKELWVSVLGLFSFLANKLDSLITTGEIGQLVMDSLSFLELAIASSETYLPTAQATYELVYELVRNAAALEKQQGLLEFVLSPGSSDNVALKHILAVTSFYTQKISATGAKDASSTLRAVVQEVEMNGLHRPTIYREREPQVRAEDILDFARHGCGDGLTVA